MKKLIFILPALIWFNSIYSHNLEVPNFQEINHSGGTDKCGCHFNRKTGEYHCHKRKQRGGDCPE